LRPFSRRDTRSGFDKVHIAYPQPKDQSILIFLLFLPETSYFHILHLLLVRNLWLPNFAFLGYPCYGVASFVDLFCRLLVIVLFCCYTRPLHQQICWLIPLTRLLSWVLFFLFLPRDLNDEVLPKRRLSPVHRRRPLLSF
jgi:hypothetical protein